MQMKTILKLLGGIQSNYWGGISPSRFGTPAYFHTKTEGKFRPEATRNLFCTFATLSVPLQVVPREGKQYGLMHFISYLKPIATEL